VVVSRRNLCLTLAAVIEGVALLGRVGLALAGTSPDVWQSMALFLAFVGLV